MDDTRNNSPGGDGQGGSQSSSAQECDPVFGKTNAILLSKQVANGQPGNFIEFSLSVSSCEDVKKTISGATVYFDLDAFTSLAGLGRKLPFTLKTKEENLEGVFDEIQGEDLFGKTGPERYHYRTDREIKLQTAAPSVTLRIELLGMRVQGDRTGGFSNSAGADLQIPIYMRFGKASPVKAEVIFEGNFP